MEMQDVLTRVQGKPITVNTVVEHLKVSGVFRNTIYQLIQIEVIANQAREMGLEVTEAELDTAQEARRRYLGLTGARNMNEHCRRHGISFEQWKQALANDLLRRKLKDALCNAAAVEKYFAENAEALRMLCIGRIVCRERREAEEILEKIRSGEGEFAQFAREHSLEHSSRIAGGHLGCFKRGMLPGEIDADLFAAEVGAVTGPYFQNDYWAIYRVEEIIRGELNQAARSHIADKMFTDWLHRAVMSARP